MLEALRHHWPEYLMEACLLAGFLVSACVFAVAFEHPGSPAHRALRSRAARRAGMALAMGATAAALIYSPWGRQSGAHMNPAFTLAFLSVGKIAPWDAAFYIAAQFAGGAAGVALSAAAMRRLISHPRVTYVATVPGARGVRAAWVGEFVISLVLVLAALAAGNYSPTAPYTGFVAAGLLAAFIVLESPLSGTSMNPARTLGSAVHSRNYRGLWVYFTAPPLAMVVAAQVYSVAGRVYCAKLNHQGDARCIFRCEIGAMAAARGRLVGIEGTGHAAAARP